MIFKNFFKKIQQDTRSSFDRMVIKRIFNNEIVLNDHIHQLYIGRYNSIWKNWLKSQNEEENIALFFTQRGESLFLDFMTSNFPFEENRFILNIKVGGTKFDIVFIIVYKFKENEIEFIENMVKEINKEGIDKNFILTRVFAECILSFSSIISESVGYKYEIMLEEVRFLKQKKDASIGDELLYLELSARPLE
ncbi:MAG: hypothetical protein EAX96_16640 [Candidatus Lokiarchaeota archaeon]|nr:hypothetical protein [Candidatus Lokiarchaeota archaeon]